MRKNTKKVTLYKSEHDETGAEETGCRYTAYLGRYCIEGESKALEFIYNAGLGEKNSQGFGMLNVL